MSVKQAFHSRIMQIGVVEIKPIKTMEPSYRKSVTYRRIAKSISEIGLIEPLVVFPDEAGDYVLLDGHTRLDIMAIAGTPSVNCILAIDNESYTYNRRVNAIPPIAQHHMILQALARVSEERVANALNVSVATIREKRDLLKGICPEAADILRNDRVSAAAFSALRKMRPVRQIDVARLMINARKFSGTFARALLIGTRAELLVDVPPARSLRPAQSQAMIEQETDDMLRHSESIKANYGEVVLQLTAACRSLEKLLANVRVNRYLTRNHQETLSAIEQILLDTAGDKEKRKTPFGPTTRETEASSPAVENVG
jgi:hypothetical protein